MTRLNGKEIDLKRFEKALSFAKKVYGENKRESGDYFFDHCVNVARMLAELNLDDSTITAGILHDITRINENLIKDVKENFGEEVVSIIEGVSEISQLRKKSLGTEADNARKLILASIKDIRVLFLKLAIKLENIMASENLPEEKRKLMAKNIMNIYAPLAHKLGIRNLKGKMENSAFKILMPKEYSFIEKKLKKGKAERELRIEKIKEIVKNEIGKRGYNFEIESRSKNCYSIYKKMKNKNKTFEELHDLVALRIITKKVEECYEVLGVLHQLWQPIGSELDDYIANPKLNMYQSIHTTVIAEGIPVEFQIRTEQMHELAEYGIAAHWKYKGHSIDSKFDKKINWMKQIINVEKDHLAKEIKIDLFGDEIFVFTPKGKVIQLPEGSTPIDFAYNIHSDVGDHCKGANVNGVLVPLKHELKTGDIIEILTSSNRKPSREWLKIVKTQKAASKIKNYLLIEENIPARSFRAIKESSEKKELEESIIDTGVAYKEIKFSKCCDIVPGNDIRGFLIKGKHLSIHDSKCSSIKKAKDVKEVNVKWKKYSNFNAGVHVIAIDRAGLFVDIFNTVNSTGTKIESAKAKPIYDNFAQCSFVIAARDIEHLREIVERIKRIKDIKNVYISI